MGGTHQPLTARFGAWSFFALGVLLALSSLGLGLWSDDWGQGLFLQKVVSGQSTSRPWRDLYVLVSGEPGQKFSGVLPWWSSDYLRIAFFRPVAAATHVMDYALWPQAPWAMHLHSALWFGSACAFAYRVVARLSPPRPAFIAAVLFAVAYVHASPVSWIAQRNALVATSLGLAALSQGLDYLEKNETRHLFACLTLIALALLASEGAVLVVVAVVLSLVLGMGTRRCWATLAGSACAVVLAWRLLYAGLGYGVRGSGTYIDPLLSSATLLSVMPGRAWTLLSMHFVPVRAGFLGDSVLPSIAAGAVVAALGVWCVLQRDRPVVRYCCGVLGCAVLLLSVAEPHARLLSLSVVFSALLLATALDSFRGGTWAALLLGGLSLAAQQWTMPRHEMRTPASREELGSLEPLLDRLSGKTLVLVDPPQYSAVHKLQRTLIDRGLAWPRWWLVLVTGPADVERVGCCTVFVTTPERAFQDASARFFSEGPGAAAPFDGLWFQAEKTEPAVFQFTFKAPLDAPQFVFVTWRNGGWELWPTGLSPTVGTPL